ncbi:MULTISPECIES: DUF1240 domain-containing protein [Photorhabdus]|uniref:Uncharacterized protein DUF1240 n=2 Tax=Photorhabdus asymbiotica TaxID=291112 RepID=A0ABX9SMF1_9GAMM|nr:DUF1240 domain-containing protein [Photorhabdus asymbiotica]RKS58208.1 uncharacterized protein DUF1240 [Photorhabdus asymbiotica]CAQ85334.1 Similar to putative membrane protein [Photorhabdus asymbiotica]
MENKENILPIICALAIFILSSFAFFLAGENLISLINMDKKVTFSGPVFIIFFSFPLISYHMILSIRVNITGRYPKHHNTYVKYSAVIAFSSFILSFPLSFYVDYKLKSKNYLVCKRISWTSPNTYVKDIKLCD